MSPILVELDESSLVGDGQRIDIDPTTALEPDHVRITGTGTGTDVSPIGDAIRGVGFATIDVGLEPTTEMIRVPVDATDAMTEAGATTPLSVRVDQAPYRPDRPLAVGSRTGTGRRIRRAERRRLRHERRPAGGPAHRTTRRWPNCSANPSRATAHLTGVPAARGAAAVDGDLATSWITPFGSPVGQALHLALDGTADSVSIAQPDGTFSPITQVRISDRPDRSTSTSTRPCRVRSPSPARST